MEAFDVLGHPIRRRIVEMLARGERTSGDVARAVGAEFGISQPAVSQHLRVLRDSGFAVVRSQGTRRLYALDPEPFAPVEKWLAGLRADWEQRLDALSTELARGRRDRSAAAAAAQPANQDDGTTRRTS